MTLCVFEKIIFVVINYNSIRINKRSCLSLDVSILLGKLVEFVRAVYSLGCLTESTGGFERPRSTGRRSGNSADRTRDVFVLFTPPNEDKRASHSEPTSTAVQPFVYTAAPLFAIMDLNTRI